MISSLQRRFFVWCVAPSLAVLAVVTLLPALYLQVLELGGRSGYMKYRTVPIYPQVGDKINKAIERIPTRQQSAADALKQAQAESIQDLQKAGIKVDS